MLPQVGALADMLEKKSVKTIFLEGLMCSSAPMLFSALQKKCPAPLLFILQDADEAGYFYHDLVQLLGESDVLFFPSSYRRAIKYGQRDAANEILRTEVLARLSSHSSPINSHLYIVTYPEAVAELVISKRILDDRTLGLKRNDTIDADKTAQVLRDLGFTEVDYVYEPGQFALRGSILDVYSYSSELPYRIDLFGDDIDSIRTFEVDTQLSKEHCEQVTIVPELVTEEEKVSFLSFLPQKTTLVVKDFLFVRDAIEAIYQEGFSEQAMTERMEGATEMEQHAIMQEMRKESQLISGQMFIRDAVELHRVEIGHRPSGLPDATITFHVSPQPQFHKNFDLLQQSLEQYIADGYQLHILADSKKQLERLKDIFAEKGTVLFDSVEKTLHEGFADNDLRLCVFTDHQMFDRFHKYNLHSDKARSGKVALTLKEIQQFEVGDYVVHVDHGIGKFGGLVRMPQGDGYQEMIKITYEGGGAIYVSIHSLYKVSKYKAQDNGQPPRLSHLGTGQWERMKERTKAKLKDIARDLIKLYAARRREKGFAFSADSFLQHELEASFLYEDTPDQLKATNDVKADMEKAQPMDRLVCGDVGFGKTEVAVRAAFKAACDSKQVAVLVPTTVLAYQHYQTFSSRLKDLPVRVEYLSRARSTKQTTAILKDLADGKVDILIGTHKLVGKTVKFRDLGLLIIDEEQKFGVSTKEKLRQMKTNVDTLTLTATPIPRTLQFSLLGARDLSIIQTPPPNRYPIQTEIHTFGAEIIADAINFEMSRNGQVYFVNPRINDLTRLKEIIEKYVPDARVAIGHGQMKPEELEQIIFDFQNYDYDVLLSTTIVENGIDIPNANTIIINGAHRFGLSDLHQMRGRVGRGNRKAFCYLLAPPLADLPVESRRRLEALENFSDLGSGIHIAMQDLDIRGAGNLLGAEQSGFIADLGYETYVKILQQAVVELRNENPQQFEQDDEKQKHNGTSSSAGGAWNGDYVSDCTLESDLELYFPDQYVPSDSERMLLYRELDGLQTDDQLVAYRTRLIDRFGPVPHVGEELMRVVSLRRLGKDFGCEKMMLKQGRMTLFFVSQNDSPFYQSEEFGRILSYVAQNPRRCQFREQNGKRSMVIADVPTVEAAVSLLKQI
ncbi:transcription-repair coupling factor (superfamily II helicase) [Prevotellaceae bacterium HUN156]|nr:transcription-repair coupling factor (superfamily II helicase) [Prevotellaceae bacterium HUN156]